MLPQRFSASSSSSSSRASSYGSDDPPCKKQRTETLRPTCGISWNQLQSLEVDTDEKDESQYAKNGKSKERVQKALKQSCCNRQCKRGLSFKMVFAVCMAFWSLTKSGQDSMLLGQYLFFFNRHYLFYIYVS